MVVINEVVVGVELVASQHVEDVAVSLIFPVELLGHVFDPFVNVLDGLVSSFRQLVLLLRVVNLDGVLFGVRVNVIVHELVDEVALVLLELSPEVEIDQSQGADHAHDISLCLHAVYALFVKVKAFYSLLVAVHILEATTEIS